MGFGPMGIDAYSDAMRSVIKPVMEGLIAERLFLIAHKTGGQSPLTEVSIFRLYFSILE